MAAEKQINVDLTFNADVSNAKKAMKSLIDDINKLSTSALSNAPLGGFNSDLLKASQAADQLRQNLSSAFNVKTGNLDLVKFNASMKSAGMSLSQYQSSLMALGPAGAQSFAQLSMAIMRADAPLTRVNSKLQALGVSLKNTAKWQLSSSILHGFMGSISSAFSYAKNLNSALNDIRIVTGASADEMAKFASQANNAAKSLSTSTKTYADAALIFYQQGLGDAEVKERTDAVIKMANVTKDSAAEVSSYMTAIWNNFDDGSKSLEHYADVMTALGAATASSTAEIAAGLEKFASIGKTIGLSYDYATSALATIVSNTRQSAEVVGNGLRTIFSRLQGLSLGETLEDGVNLNKYSKALSAVGVSILDASGQMKSMDSILESLASKWETLSSAQQTALAQTVGGVRQYTTLISLMNNWDDMQTNLNTAGTSTGTLQEQADIYAESWEGARNRVKASAESIYSSLVNDDFFISLNNGFAGFLDQINNVIDGLGGLKGTLLSLAPIIASVFRGQINNGVRTMAMSLQALTPRGRQEQEKTRTDAVNNVAKMYESSSTQSGFAQASHYRQLAGLQNSFYQNKKYMSPEVQQRNQQAIQTYDDVYGGRVRGTSAAVDRAAQATSNNRVRNNAVINNAAKARVRQDDKAKQANNGNTTQPTPTADEYKAQTTQALNTLGSQAAASGFQRTAAQMISAKVKVDTTDVATAKKQILTLIETLKAAAAENGIDLKASGMLETLNKIESEAKQATDSLDGVRTAAAGLEGNSVAQEGAVIDAQASTDDEGNPQGFENVAEKNGMNRDDAKAMGDQTRADMDEFGASIAENAGAMSDAKLAAEELKEQINGLGKTKVDFSSGFVAASSAIMAVGGAISSVQGLMNVWSDESSTLGDKLITTFTTVGSVALSMGTAFMGANGALLKGIPAAVATAMGYEKVGGSFVKAAAGSGVAGSSFLTTGMIGKLSGMMVQAGFAPITAIVLIIVAALAILIGTFAAISAVVGKVSDAYNADAIAAEQAAEAARNLASAYGEVKEAYQSMVDSMDQYSSAREQLKTLTEGTEEYADALATANETGLDIINNNPEFKQGEDYRWENGELIIDETAMKRVKKEKASDVAEARAASLMADAKAAEAKAKAAQTELVRKDDAGNVWKNIGAGAVGGAALGAAGGLPGLLIGALGGAVTGLIQGLDHNSTENDAEREKINSLVKDYQTLGEEAFDPERLRKLGFDTANQEYIDSLEEVVKATAAAADQTSNAARLAAEELLSLDDDYNKIQDEGHKNNVGAAGGRIYQNLEDKYYQEYLAAAGDRGFIFNTGTDTSEKAFAEYAKLMGLKDYDATDFIGRGENSSVKYTYTDENGEKQEKTVTAKEMARRLAASKATDEFGKSQEDFMKKINKLEGSESKADKAISDFLGGDMTQSSMAEWQSLQSEYGFSDGMTDKEIGWLLDKQFGDGKDGKISDDTAQKYGYKTAAEMTKAFKEEYNRTMEAWDDISLPKGMGEWGENLSLAAAQKLENIITDLNLGPLGESIGTEFVGGLDKMLKTVSEKDQDTVLNQLMNIDWSSWDAIEQADIILREFGEGLDLTDPYWENFINHMRIASRAIPDFSKMKSELNGVAAVLGSLELGEAISEEDYQTLIDYNHAWADFFATQADGSRKFIGNAEEMSKALIDMAKDHQELLQTYSTAAEVTEIAGFDWDRDFIKLSDKSSQKDKKAQADQLDKAEQEFNDLREAHKAQLDPVLQALGYLNEDGSIAVDWNSAEQVQALFDALAQAIDPTYLDQIDDEFKEMIASTATSLSELQTMLSSEAIDAEAYSKALIVMGSGYEYCTSAVEAYQQAIGTDGEDRAREALEAAIEVEEAASKLETAYSHAMSGKSSMTVEDLNALKESNEELYNSFLTMSDNDWYEAAYQAQRELLNQRIATHGEETAEYKTALIERQKLDEEYLETKKEKQKEVFDGFIENWESENKKIQTAVDALDIFSDGTTWGEQGFEAIETLRQALLDTGKTAEEVDAILKNLGKDEEMTDVETLWAATREKAKLLLEQAGNSQQAAAKLGVDASTELIITDAKSTTPKVNENESGDAFEANTTAANLPVNIQDNSGTKTSGAAVLWDANGAYVNVKDPNGKPIKVYIDDSGAVFDEGVITPLGDGTYGVNWSAVANKDFIGSVGGNTLGSATEIGLKKEGDSWVVVFGTANQTFTGTVGGSDLTGGKLFFDTADNKWKVQWGDGTTKDFTAYLKASPGEENPFTTYFEEDPQGGGWVLKLKNANGEEITLTLNADALNKDKLATSHPYLDMTEEGLTIKTKNGFLTLTPNLDFTNSNFGIDKDGNLTFNGAVLPLDENGAIDFSQLVYDRAESFPEVVKTTGAYQDYTPTIWEEIFSFGSATNPFDVIQNEYDGNFIAYLEDREDFNIDSDLIDLIVKSRNVLTNEDSYDVNEIALAKSVFAGMGMTTASRYQNPLSYTTEDYINNRQLTEADLQTYRSHFIESTMMDLEKITGYNFSEDYVSDNYGNGYVFEKEDYFLKQKGETPFKLNTNANLQWMSENGYDEFVRQYFDGMLSEIMIWNNDDGTNDYLDAIEVALMEAINSTDKQVQQQGYFIAQGLLEAASQGLSENDPIIIALQELIARMNETLGIESPSKVTMQMGRYLAQGLQKGALEEDIDLSPMAEKALTSIKNYLDKHGKDLSLDKLITGITQEDLQAEYEDALSAGTTEAADVATYAQEKGYTLGEDGQWKPTTQEGKKNYLAAQGANIQTTKDGKSYITDKNGKVISGLYDNIDDAILAGYQTLYSEEAMTKYFTGKIDENDEFLSYMEDDALTAIQKGMMTSVIQGAVDAANKEGNLSTYVTSWEELVEAVGFDKAMEYLESSYGNTSVQFLNDIKSVWAEYSDLMVLAVETHVGIEDKAAKEVVDIWKNAFAAILKAKQAMIDGESFASALSEEEIKSFVELYAGSGKSAKDIRTEMFKTSGQTLPEFNMQYNSADSRSFVDSLLTYDETTGYVTSDPLKTDKTGKFIIPTDPNSGYQQFKTNLTNDVTSIIQAGMTDQATGEMWDFKQLFESQDFQAALKEGNMDNAFAAAQKLFPSITREVVELLAGTATAEKDENGNVTSHKMAENVSVADFTQAYIDKTYSDLPQTYQDTVVGRITADIGQINTLKTNLTTQGDNFIKARQSEVDLVDKARGLLVANESLAENLTLAEQETLKELTGKSDLAAISIGDLGTATTKLSGIMETASTDLSVAMGMLERGEATGFTINSDGTVSVSKSMSYATAAASGQTISEADKTAAEAAASAARKAAEDAYREAHQLKEDASDADKAAYEKAVADAGDAAYKETLDNFNVTVNITLNGEGVYVSDTVTNASNATATATAQADETYATSAGFTDTDEMNDYIAMMEAQGGNDNFSDGGMLTAEAIMNESLGDEIDTKEKAVELQREYAHQLSLMEQGLSELNSSGKDWIKTLKSQNASMADQAKALSNLRKSYQKVLGLTDKQMDMLGDDFLKNEKNLELVAKAAEKAGKEGADALDELQANAALTIIQMADFKDTADTLEEVTALFGKAAEEISKLNFDAGEMITGADAAYATIDGLYDSIVALGGGTEEAMATAAGAIEALGYTPAPITTETISMTAEQVRQYVEIDNQEAYDAQGNPITVSNLDPFLSTNAESYQIQVPIGTAAPGIKTGQTGTVMGYRKNAEKTGGGRRGGGGGGSRRRYLAKAKPEDHKERYHEIDNAIDDVTDALERLNKQQDRAWGADRLKSMQAESAELKKQADLIHDKITEAEAYLNTDLDDALKAGWEFDEDGNVSNYEEHWDSLLAGYNNAVEEYNNMSISEQEAIDKKFEEANDKYYEAKAKGDTAGMEEWGEYINPETEVAFGSYEEYLKYHMLDAPTEALEQYEETMELLEDLGLEMADVLNSWYDNVLEQIQYKLDLALELTENELNIIDYKLKSIEDNAYRAGEALGLMTQKMDASKSNFNAYYTALDDLLKANNADWSADKLLSGEIGAKDLADAGLQSGDIDIIKTVMEGLRESTSAMTEQMVEGYETMTNSFDSFNEELERYISTIEHAQNVTSTYKNILDLTGRSMSGFTSTMLKELNTLIVSQAQNKLTSSKTTLDTIKQEFEVAKDAYEQAQDDFANGKIDQAALDAAKDAYNSAQDTLNEAEENFLTSWEETLQAAADAFESNIEEITRTIGEALSGGLAGGLAELEDQFAKVKEQDEMYVDDYEKIYQLTKLTRDLESKIDNTTNVRAQKEMLKLQKEINGLLESDKELSQYDIEYLQKKADLKLAEIAMQDAQNAKSQVMMRRDSEGNYNYVYTADEDAVEQAEQEYADKLYEMQVANDEYITTLQENMSALSSQMLNEIASIDRTVYDTEEKYQAEVERITTHYSTMMGYYNSEMKKVLDNNTILYNEDWTEFNKFTGYKISAAENYVTKWNQTMLSQITGFDTQEDYYGNFNKTLFGDNPESPSSDSLIGQVLAAYSTMTQQIAAANEAAGLETGTLAGLVMGNIDAATDEAEAAAQNITTQAGLITTAIEGIGTAISTMAANYAEDFKTMSDATDVLNRRLSDFLTMAGSSQEFSIDAGVLSQIRARLDAEGFDTGGYTGAWGSEGKLAFLHQKELVLNAHDTANMLASVGILRQIANVIDLNALSSAGGFASLMQTGVHSNKETLQQEVHIEAHFPNATDKNQIEDAFKDIVNLAAQYANRSSF